MNFLKTFLAALLAFVVANILIFIFFMMIFAGITAATGPSVEQVRPNSVLHLDLVNGITDEPYAGPLVNVGLMGIEVNSSNSLMELIGAVENAAYDSNIKGIYLNLTGGSISLANIEELRAALVRFKQQSGKFIISYNESYGQLGYYLASVADKVFINPEGGFNWYGMSSQVMFFKGLLDKLGIRAEIFRHGTFKSAVEPFMQEKMSPENRTQMETMLNSIWGVILDDISESRRIPSDILDRYAETLAVYDPLTAFQAGMVDALLYEDQVLKLLERLVESGPGALERETHLILADYNPAQQKIDAANIVAGVVDTVSIPAEYADNAPQDAAAVGDSSASGEESVAKPAGRSQRATDTGPRFISLPSYINSMSTMTGSRSRNRIAVIYLDGDIVDGPSSVGTVGSATISQKLRRAADDDAIKAVVLRVNSPGGSALASEVMWREIENLRTEKPVIVSMGAYAASGGYYVSAPADMIIASRSTITGSIGVFGLMLNYGDALRGKLGVTVDVAKTNQYADMGSPYRSVTPTERQRIMQGIEDVYKTFVGHVADGRNMSPGDVDAIGGGRVWSGANARDIGLVDDFGGLSDAISAAAAMANVTGDYRVREMVDQPDSFTMMLKSYLGAKVRTKQEQAMDEMGEMFIHYNRLQNMVGKQGVYAMMPYHIEIQ